MIIWCTLILLWVIFILSFLNKFGISDINRKQKYIKKHRKMWLWIAHEIENKKCFMNIELMKNDYLISIGDHNILSGCYLCEYNKKYSKRRCHDKCLLIWTGGSCCDANSEYILCDTATTWEEQYLYALKIANLTERR